MRSRTRKQARIHHWGVGANARHEKGIEKKFIIELRSIVRSKGYEMQEIVPSLAGGEGVITGRL
jgi:hypothetical protein